MFALRLRDGSLLLHSPTTIDDAHDAQLDALGAPSLLFAPTAVHHLSLERYRQRYPNAVAVAGRHALAGLVARKHEGVQDIEQHTDKLPDGMRVHCAEGTRWGETWLSLRDDDGSATLVVCDAFFHVGRPTTGAMGFALRTLGIREALCVGRTFKWAAVKDRAAYCAWATRVLREVRPTTLLVSHCEPVRDTALTDTLVSLVDAMR